MRPKLAAFVVSVGLVVAACGPPGGGSGGGGHGGGDQARRGPVAPLGGEGRWLVDTTGRVVTLHGMNEVYKSAPYYPAADGFGDDDAAFLAEQGFNAVRLGVEMLGLMPQAGEVDHGYIENLARSVDALADEGVFVLLDFHQDCWGSKYDHNGFPEWMTVDDDRPLGDTAFPLCYVNSPAIQRAFESFWANRPASDGVGVQDHFVTGLTAVVERFADEPHVVGYELLNEPWPGADWQACIFGDAATCAEQERELLVPFHERATAAVREITDIQQVWVEPFVLFNFGQVGTGLPGADGDNVLSFHSYALDEAGEEGVIRHAVEAVERDGAPGVATEFGATMDVATLQRLTGQMDSGMFGWMFWAYNENVVTDRAEPASLDQVRNLDTFKALVRPYPVAVAGTPIGWSFDPATQVFELTYDTDPPGNRRIRGHAPTIVSIAELQYPDGYAVEVTGAKVTSRRCADKLTLKAKRHAEEVTVRVTPGGRCR